MLQREYKDALRTFGFAQMKILQALGVLVIVIGLAFLLLGSVGLVSPPYKPVMWVCPAIGSCGPSDLQGIGYAGLGYAGLGVLEIGVGIVTVGTILLLAASVIGRTLKSGNHDAINLRTKVID